jgi:hypothetical protein
MPLNEKKGEKSSTAIDSPLPNINDKRCKNSIKILNPLFE